MIVSNQHSRDVCVVHVRENPVSASYVSDFAAVNCEPHTFSVLLFIKHHLPYLYCTLM